jgi:hypothetical protein
MPELQTSESASLNWSRHNPQTFAGHLSRRCAPADVLRALLAPAVLWVSESGAKVVARDDELASQLKLKISADRQSSRHHPGGHGS